MKKRLHVRIFATVAVLALASTSMFAQGFEDQQQAGRGGGRGGAPSTAKGSAPVDFTGYWAAIVVEDWRYRMLPPEKYTTKPTLGSREDIPMNAAAREIALAWDPSKDEAAGEQCRAYGAPNIMRMPGRMHITWQDDQTLKLETDAGTQMRLFEFGTPKGQGGGWQGVSHASWDTVPGGRGASLPTGSFKVVTTKIKPGYLRKNGIPYSANATVNEYYDRVDEPGASYIVITTTVEDPTYLTQPYLTSTHFKKEADASGWKPSPCTAR